MDVARTRHPSASATCLCAPHRMPTSVAVSCDCVHPPPPPLCLTWPAPRSLSAPGGFVCCRSLRLSCAPNSSSLSDPLNPRIFRFLVSCRLGFHMRARGQGASTTWQSIARDLSPPRMPTSVAGSWDWVHPPPPFAALGLHPGPCQPLGGLSVAGPSVSPVPPTHPP